MRISFFAFIVLFLFAQVGKAQELDSLKAKKNILDNKFTTITLLSVPLFYQGWSMRNDKTDFSTFRNFHTELDNYTQFLPFALTVGLKLGGVKSSSSWKKFLFASAMSYIIDESIVNIMKSSIYEKRPDISANNSFPSGHTALAFMNAHIFVKEYAEDNWLVSTLAYTTASFTGAMRVMNQRHWMGDVLAGAGIGLFSAETAYCLADFFFDRQNKTKQDLFYHHPLTELKKERFWADISTTYNYSFNKYKIHGYIDVEFANGGAVGVESAWMYNTFLGVGVNADYSNYRYVKHDAWEKYDIAFYYIGLSQYLSLPIDPRVSVGCRVGIGMSYSEHYKKLLFVSVPNEFHTRYNVGVNLNLRLKEHTLFRFYADFTDSDIVIDKERYPFRTINLGASLALCL